MRSLRVQAGLVIAALSGFALSAIAQSTPTATYWVYVAAESADLVHLVSFGPNGARLEKTIPVGESAVETEGPHGLRVSPDKRYLYMTTGHGIPDGKLWKYETGSDTLVAAPILLGFFPATLDLTPDGLYAFITNFNLHGEMIPSSVSVVYTPSMMEVTQTETCTMPHGNRMNPSGSRTYSACMMDDQIVELDTQTFEVARRFSVTKDHEGPTDLHAAGPHTAMSRGGNAMASTCSPTWVQTNPAGNLLYVACNKGDEILEISVNDWKLTRKFATGRGPYNMAFTPDGRNLVVSLKQGAGVQFFALPSGESRRIVPSSTTVTHGVEVTPDSRYVFVSVEGVGAEPGKVDIYDVESLEMVGSVAIGQQAGGIAFWKTAN
jgi:DNA-binding beta-propeller fold protein YncE